MDSTKPTVGFLSPQPYMEKAISMMEERYNVQVLTPQGWDDENVAAMVGQCRENDIRAVAGFAQKDAFHHILINEQLENATPSRLAFLYCMNKYLMRTLEADPFWFDAIDPIKETDEEIIAKIAQWPFMLKNTSLSLGRGIFKIETPDKLREVLQNYRQDADLQKLIAFQNEHFSKGIDAEDMPTLLPPFIAEHLVDMSQAIEYCYEGYVTADGEVVHYALTEEVYFSNHQALGYLTPPLSINAEKAEEIAAWADDYMGRLSELGYRNQFFNLEFWIMPGGKIALTEINPRAAHSYHYNYLYSFGTSLFEDNLRLVETGNRLADSPWRKWVDNEAFNYTLIVLITAKQVDRVGNILDYDYVDYLERDQGILIRHNRQRDDQLSEEDMTAAGVMLLQLWITAGTPEELIRREKEIRAKIYQQPQEDCDYPAHWVAD